MSRDQNAGLSRNIKTDTVIVPLKRWKISSTVFGNNLNRSKFNSGRKKEQTEIRECLLSFDAYSFVFQFAIQKFKDPDIHNSNFACCFVRVCNFVAHIEGGT